MSEQSAQGNAPKTLTYQQLRMAAEAAASYRDQEVYLIVDADGWSVKAERPANPEGKAVIPVKSPGKPTAPPRVGFAKIGINEATAADLRNLKDPNGVAIGPADAVFWSPAAVEKFLVPYYASVYGDWSPTKLTALIGILGAPRAPIAHVGSAFAYVDAAADAGAFAVAHMPKSEYVQIDDGGLAVIAPKESLGPVAYSLSDWLAGKP